MVWHSKQTFYARRSRKSWSISLVFVSEWVIISLFISYFWELCDLCLDSQSLCCQTPLLITESGSKTGYGRNYYKAVCCLLWMQCLLSLFFFFLCVLTCEALLSCLTFQYKPKNCIVNITFTLTYMKLIKMIRLKYKQLDSNVFCGSFWRKPLVFSHFSC